MALGGRWLGSHPMSLGAQGWEDPREVGRYSHKLDDFVQALDFIQALRVRTAFIQRQPAWGQERTVGPSVGDTPRPGSPGKESFDWRCL